MRISFVAEPLEYGELVGLIVSLQGEDVPHGQIRQAIYLPGKKAPSEDIAQSVLRLRLLANWIDIRKAKESPPRLIDSRIFGKTRNATDAEITEIRQLVEDVPVAVFGALNKALNARGLISVIDVYPAGKK